MAGDVETRGELTLGTTVFDRRANPRWRPNMDVAVKMDAKRILSVILRSLELAGQATR
jgi:inosine-uridine nucleoside N-ribohydrolase